jgi:simple sugar transport system substrate-binding protein
MKGVNVPKPTLLKSLSSHPKRRVTAALAVASVTVLGLALTACTGGGGGGGNAAEGSDGANAGTADGVTIAIMGGAPDDPFWSTVKNGAESAALAVEAAGGSVEFVSMPNYDNFNADAAKLVANIKAMNPTAVIVPNWSPDSQNENIQAITSEGIPVIIYNSGQDSVEDVGAEIYIGTDDYEAGVAGGEKLAEIGTVHALCVNTLPGTVNIDARCQGIADGATPGGVEVTDLNLPATQFGDPTAITQAIKGAILNDDTIDVIVTIGANDSDSGAAAIEQSGVDGVQLASFDVSKSGLDRVKAGTQLYSIDQQPYAQGFYAVSYAFQLAAYGIELPLARLLTGPALITSENVDVVIKGTENGTR